MRVGVLAYSARDRDALGNHLAETLAFFAERGAEARLFLENDSRLHPEVRPFAHVVTCVEDAGPVWEFLQSADLVLAQYPHWHDLLHYLPLLAGTRARLVVDYHGVTPARFFSGPQADLLEQSAARRGIAWCADAVIAHSRFAQEELQAATDLPSERIIRIGYPLHPAFSPGPPAFSLAERLGLEEARVLLFVGRLAANKRLPVLVEALARVRTEQPPVHLAVVGDNTDIYAAEMEQCLDLAWNLGVRDRLHFLGQLDQADLVDAYRGADLVVMPSVHEGFCLPVIEAMACGTPVLAARAAALPETVGDAGWTFRADDPEDLANQVRRLLAKEEGIGQDAPLTPDPSPPKRGRGGSGPQRRIRQRVAIVSFRFGADIAGGAERSLRTMAQALRQAGHEVEVFTTCTRSESQWRNELPAGTIQEDGLTIHRFPIDDHDRARHLETVRIIVESGGQVSPEEEAEYLRHSIHSSALLAALERSAEGFDAIIAGPYLFGLTHDVATRLARKTLVVPCFHEEPLARLACWPQTYGAVGGLLFHSPEEQELAQTRLGVNHPNAHVVGTWIGAATGRERMSSPLPHGRGSYLVYCGRYSPEKNLPLLLDYLARYQADHPGRFELVCLGQGDMPLPQADWLRDRGWVDEGAKAEVIAGAAALVQLSTQESLSLAGLEAWALGVPVLASAECAALAGHIERGGGGRTVASYEGFAEALDELWEHPERWRNLGERGRIYVAEQFTDRDAYVQRLEAAVAGLVVSPAQQARQRGPERARRFSRSAWRESLSAAVEWIMDAPSAPRLERGVVHPWQNSYGATPEHRSLLVPVRVENQGQTVLLPDGPCRTLLHTQVVGRRSGPLPETRSSAPLHEMVLPGRRGAALIPVDVPRKPGDYEALLWLARELDDAPTPPADAVRIALHVRASGEPARTGSLAPLLDAARTAVAQAQRLEQLPDSYVDVCEGWFARLKRWLKRKLLGNFQRAYVDVLSRQQTKVNRQLVASVHQLAEACAALDHALTNLQARQDSRRVDPQSAAPSAIETVPASSQSAIRNPQSASEDQGATP